ncbi:MAG: beta/gamma crystallin domain-containing protein [Gammaproteobacteria bacterium]
MNRIQLVLRGFKTGLVLTALGLGTGAHAKDNDCWAKFYENAQYQGKHLMIQGPDQLPSLLSVNGESWDLRIDSIKVGPKAKVTVFENPNFKLTLTEMAKYPGLMKALGITEQDIKEDSELIFTADTQVHSLGEFNFHDKVRSLKVECLD